MRLAVLLATVKELGKLGFLGIVFLPSTAAPAWAMSNTSLPSRNSRVDGSVGIIVAAHTSLVFEPCFLAGNEAQKKKYVSKLATGEFYRAWGLTEPSSGSDAGSAA